MKTVKRITIIIVSIILVSIFNLNKIIAYDFDQLEAANNLAKKGIINTQVNTSGYKLDQNILRQEIAAITGKIAGIKKKTICDGVYKDVTAVRPNNWACYSIEALSDNNFIALNENFRPEEYITKAEAVGMIVKATFGENYSYNPFLGTSWQKQVVNFAVDKKIVSNFSNYNDNATRGFVFNIGYLALELKNKGDAIDDTTDDTTDDTDILDKDLLTITLSPDTPKSATIPGRISGLPVAKFDFTAGNEDVTITSLTLKRRGLSDSETLDELTIFTDEGRVSKSRDDSLENGTQAQITLSSGGLTIKAGETKTLTVVANIASSNISRGDEFAIELINVNANSNVKEIKNLISNTLRIGSVDAAEITIDENGNVPNVNSGDENAILFKFAINGSNDQDVILKSITLKNKGSVRPRLDLENFKLLMNDKVIATIKSTNNDYITFNLGNGVIIPEDKKVSFSVNADIIAGVTETVAFIVEKSLDVSAVGTKYGYGVSVDIDSVDEEGDLGSIIIDAGELVLYKINAPYENIRANKKNIILGSIRINNVSGSRLELSKLIINVDIISNNSNFDEANEIFENFEVVFNKNSYELDYKNNAFSDTDLDILLAEGVTEMIIRADTKEDIPVNTGVDISIIGISNTGFVAIETEDDEKVSDITPSSLSFKQLTFIDSEGTLSPINLPDVTVVRGSDNIVVNHFQIEAGEASPIEINEVIVDVNVSNISGGPNIISSSINANKYISKIALYLNSVSDINLLDVISGSKITSTGKANFEGFNVKINNSETETFVVAIDIVDGIDVENKFITVDVSSISAEDDENDNVTISGTAPSNKEVKVSSEGSIIVKADASNNANKDPKTILAGESEAVFSADIQAINENVDIETVVFTYSGDDLTNSLKNASLYLDNEFIATNSNSDITYGATTGTITFKNLSDFIVPTKNIEFELVLNTNNIGYEKVGEAVSGIEISKVSFSNAEGVYSGNPITISDLTTTKSNTFSIVPAVITPSVVVSLNNSTIPQLKISAETGNNTLATSNTKPKVEIDTITFSTLGTTDTNESIVYRLINAENSSISLLGTYSASSNKVTFDLTNGTFDTAGLNLISSNSSETFKIIITGAGSNEDTLNLTLLDNGIKYNVDTTTGITTNLISEIDFGSRTY